MNRTCIDPCFVAVFGNSTKDIHVMTFSLAKKKIRILVCLTQAFSRFLLYAKAIKNTIVDCDLPLNHVTPLSTIIHIKTFQSKVL